MQIEIAIATTLLMRVYTNVEDTTFATLVGMVIEDVDIKDMIEEPEHTILCPLVMITMTSVYLIYLCMPQNLIYPLKSIHFHLDPLLTVFMFVIFI